MRELRVTDLAVAFGGNRVLRGVTFAIGSAQVCGLIGPNGAGKSTLVNALTGVHPPAGGAIMLEGERIDGLPPYAVARRGLGRTFQVSRAFGRMSVLENLLVPARGAGREDRARQALDLLRLDHLRHEPARALSGGQLKLLELGRLLMLDPAILLLDEPFAGVHPRLRGTIGGFIAGLRADGRAVVVIEHDLRAVFALAERLLVLAGGVLIADGPPAEVRADPAVIDAYLGGAGELDIDSLGGSGDA